MEEVLLGNFNGVSSTRYLPWFQFDVVTSMTKFHEVTSLV